MTTKLFYNLRDDFGLKPINVRDGKQLVSGREPDVTYFHPEGAAHGYELDSTKDDFIIEALSDNGENPDMHLSASQSELEELDEYLMEKIEESDSEEHYKRVN